MSTNQTIGLTTRQLSRRLGVTVRRLDHWARKGVVFPTGERPAPGSGRHRRWTERDVDTVSAVSRLVDLGCPLTVLVSVSSEIRTNGGRGTLFISGAGDVSVRGNDSAAPFNSGWFTVL